MDLHVFPIPIPLPTSLDFKSTFPGTDYMLIDTWLEGQVGRRHCVRSRHLCLYTKKTDLSQEKLGCANVSKPYEILSSPSWIIRPEIKINQQNLGPANVLGPRVCS